jgi:hypothetical protein
MKHRFYFNCASTPYQRVFRDHGDEGRDSKVGEYAAIECVSTNTFNAIVETNGTLKRRIEGKIVNPPK